MAWTQTRSVVAFCSRGILRYSFPLTTEAPRMLAAINLIVPEEMLRQYKCHEMSALTIDLHHVAETLRPSPVPLGHDGRPLLHQTLHQSG